MNFLEEKITYNKKLSGAVEQTADLVVITDKNGVIEYVNPSFEKLTGYTKEEAIGKTPRILRSGHHDSGFYKSLWGTVLAGNVFQAEFVNMKKNGELFHENKTITPIRDEEENITHFVSTGKDITEQRVAEIEKEKAQAQYYHAQKMEAIGTLVAGFAHNFDNLMTVTMGYSSLGMKKTEKESPLHNYFQNINSASARASDLIGQLLLFSRKQPIELKPLNINATIENVMKILPRIIGENISIETNLEEKPWTVIANEENTVQILMDLALNAKDAMPEGGKLHITTRNMSLDEEYCRYNHDARSGDFVSISVSDTGTGIEKEIIPRVFEPFFTTKEIGKGKGLGLSVVYGILKEHEGWVSVDSEPGTGSTFSLYFPAVPIGG